MFELTTELEAVNVMLESIGERPVNELGTSQRQDVLRAENALRETLRMVQNKGWWFNTLEEQELTPDVNDQIILADNTLKFIQLGIAFNFDRRRLALRKDTSDDKLKVYNLKDRTFTIEDVVFADLVEGLEFDELPETPRRYIALRAAVTFQARSVGSRILHAFSEAEAAEAWVDLRREEEEYQSQHGNLNVAPLVRDIILKR